MTASDFLKIKIMGKKGNMLVTFWDNKNNPPFQQLCNAIKTKGTNSKGKTLYAYFALTNRRNEILYQMHQAWQLKKIAMVPSLWFKII